MGAGGNVTRPSPSIKLRRDGWFLCRVNTEHRCSGDVTVESVGDVNHVPTAYGGFTEHKRSGVNHVPIAYCGGFTEHEALA
jgi:hypothetical protein